MLANACSALAPGGRFVLDVVGKENLSSRFRPTDCRETDDGRMLVERRKVVANWTRLETQWLLLEGGHYERFEVNL